MTDGPLAHIFRRQELHVGDVYGDELHQHTSVSTSDDGKRERDVTYYRGKREDASITMVFGDMVHFSVRTYGPTVLGAVTERASLPRDQFLARFPYEIRREKAGPWRPREDSW